MYLVHPGYAGDCDFEGVAKEGVIRELDYAVKEEQRAILIYPTNAGVYIDSDKVTDVRGGYEEENWISYDDFQGVSCATFVGGKIRKCLGVSYGNFIDVAERMGIEEISVRLPLESIVKVVTKWTNLSKNQETLIYIVKTLVPKVMSSTIFIQNMNILRRMNCWLESLLLG